MMGLSGDQSTHFTGYIIILLYNYKTDYSSNDMATYEAQLIPRSSYPLPAHRPLSLCHFFVHV